MPPRFDLRSPPALQGFVEADRVLNRNRWSSRRGRALPVASAGQQLCHRPRPRAVLHELPPDGPVVIVKARLNGAIQADNLVGAAPHELPPAFVPRIDLGRRLARIRSAANPRLNHKGFNSPVTTENGQSRAKGVSRERREPMLRGKKPQAAAACGAPRAPRAGYPHRPVAIHPPLRHRMGAD